LKRFNLRRDFIIAFGTLQNPFQLNFGIKRAIITGIGVVIMNFIGKTFIFSAVLSFLLSYIGIQFKFMAMFGGSFKFSITLAVIGILILALTPEEVASEDEMPVAQFVIMVIFAVGLVWFLIPKNGPSTSRHAVRENPTELYTQCFTKKSSDNCRKLAGYYRKTGNLAAANSSMYKACALGDKVSCGGLRAAEPERLPASAAIAKK